MPSLFQPDIFQPGMFQPSGTFGSSDWSYQIDGTELNDGVAFVTYVPEIESQPDMQIILRAVDGDYPSFIRLQAMDMGYTFLIAMNNCPWPTWSANVAALKTLFSPGMHTFTVQARGQSSPTSIQVVSAGSMMLQPQQRILSISVKAPKPVFA